MIGLPVREPRAGRPGRGALIVAPASKFEASPCASNFEALHFLKQT
jgi:hypothetical protein